MIISLLPPSLNNVLVYRRLASDLGQACTALNLLESNPEHVTEDFRDFEYLCCHWFKFFLQDGLSRTRTFPEYFVKCLRVLFNSVLGDWFALWEEELRHRHHLLLLLLYLLRLGYWSAYGSLSKLVSVSGRSLRFVCRILQLGVLVTLLKTAFIKFRTFDRLWRSSGLLWLVECCETGESFAFPCFSAKSTSPVHNRFLLQVRRNRVVLLFLYHLLQRSTIGLAEVLVIGCLPLSI